MKVYQARNYPNSKYEI